MRANHLIRTATLLLFAASMASAVSGQTDTGNWQVLRPTGEEFSILMPKDPLIETGKMPYHKMELNTRLYLSTGPNGPTLAVVSLSGIKSNPAMYSEMERLNSYVDAFKKLFVPKVTSKAVVTKFVMTGTKELNGHSGREYQVTIGDRTGTAQVFATRKRFYAVVFLTDKKADALRDQFLGSFALPQNVPKSETVARQPQQNEKPAPTVADEEQEKLNEYERERQEAIANSSGVKGQRNSATTDPPQTEPTLENKPNEPAPQGQNSSSGERKPISGGVLNGKALSLPLPPYPPEARAANASGSVSVKVLIDEYGNVTSAEAVSGHPLLRSAAVAAAMQARFSQTMLMGEPVKVTGVIIYSFRVQ